jgi:predicted negative regulator of RcsB-dependent stress response
VPKHITRQELKHDEFRDTIEHGAEAIAAHQSQVWLYGGVAILVVAAILGWRFYTQRQTAQASAGLADAMKVYQARIRPVNESAAPGELTYVDEKNRDTDAAKKFDEIADRYSRTQPGLVSRYYAGLALTRAGRFDEALKDLTELESGRDEGFASLARFQIAQIYENTGKAAQAVQTYQQLIDKPTVFVPKAVSLLALADHYAKSDPAQSAKLYQQVKSEFPNTQAAQEADQRLQLLPAKG